MEQITKKEDKYFYGTVECNSVDDAYSRFRSDYHASLGRDKSRRLDRVGTRKERIHGYGTYYAEPPCYDGRGLGKVSYRILGIVGISYCRIIGCWDYKEIGNEDFERWFNWAFASGNKALKLVGRKDKAGRTSKRATVRYR